LNEKIDRRLLSTFFELVIAMHQHCNAGFLLSEWGGYILGPEWCCAGTKRISKPLHSEKEKAKKIHRYL
jgi:hypothetical protein